MFAFVIYQLKVALAIAAFYLCFKLFLSRDNLHGLNRAVLISTSVLSFILPLCIITLHKSAPTPEMADPGILNGLTSSGAEGSTLKHGSGWQLLAIAVYWSGVLAVLSSIAVGVIRVTRLIESGERKELDGTEVIVCDKLIAPFSWMKKVVIGRADYESGNTHILEHEKAHVRLKHSIDVLLVNVMSSFQWFNPAAWLLKQDLKAIHEFEADDAVLRAGADIREYQYSLIRKAVHDSGYSITNGFSHSVLRNRIFMMQTPRVSAVKGLKVLYVLPLVCISLAINARTIYDYDKVAPVHYPLVEVTPTFCGGDAKSFAEWVNSNLTFPAEAVAGGLQGRMTLQFVINEMGHISDVSVLRGLDPEIDAEVVRIISSCPDWTPGESGGRKVPVILTFPVIFEIP